MASKAILTNIDLNKNELQNAVIQPLATAPSGAKEGQIYHNSTDKLLYQYDGADWNPVGAVLSVNGKTGIVVLTQDDVGDGSTYVRTHNDLTDELALLINGALQKSGGTMTGAIAMGSHKITGLTNGSAATDAAAFGQIPVATTTSPKMDGTAAVGSETKWAKGDHVHPTDTSRAPLASPALTGTPTAPTAASGTDTTQIATTAFVQAAVAGLGEVMVFKGIVDASHALPNTHKVGWTYKVGAAGTYAGVACEVGDTIVCVADGTTASNNDWYVLQANIDGAVTGPSSATNGHIPTFNGNSGKVIKDGYGVATSISNSSTTIPTTAAVNTALTGLIKTATGNIGTSATSATVSYSGTLINAYATMGGSEVVVDIAYGNGTVTFSTAQAPAAAVTCVVVYA